MPESHKAKWTTKNISECVKEVDAAFSIEFEGVQ